MRAVLGRACAEIEPSDLGDVPAEDDREFFVSAWCWHPSFINDEYLIFLSEAHLPLHANAASLPGLWYWVRVRLVAFQDHTPPLPPPPPEDDEDDDGSGGEDGDNGSGDVCDGDRDEGWPTPQREGDGSPNSNCNNFHPTSGWGCRHSLAASSVASSAGELGPAERWGAARQSPRSVRWLLMRWLLYLGLV